MQHPVSALSSEPAGARGGLSFLADRGGAGAERPALSASRNFVRDLFRERHRADVNPTYLQWRSITDDDGRILAILGYRSAGNERLFLENYLADPIEDAVSEGLNMPVDRTAIVEIGCLAAVSSWALLELWHTTAIALRQDHKVAVATLTAPVRRSLERLGLSMVELEAADPAKLPASCEDWGSYYDLRPTVCAGLIAQGARALTAAPQLRRVL